MRKDQIENIWSLKGSFENQTVFLTLSSFLVFFRHFPFLFFLTISVLNFSDTFWFWILADTLTSGHLPFFFLTQPFFSDTFQLWPFWHFQFLSLFPPKPVSAFLTPLSVVPLEGTPASWSASQTPEPVKWFVLYVLSPFPSLPFSPLLGHHTSSHMSIESGTVAAGIFVQ